VELECRKLAHAVSTILRHRGPRCCCNFEG
jgi:hypothetical protein